MAKYKDKIRNDEKVIAYTQSGKKLNFKFGELKDKFMHKSLPEPIIKVYAVRQQQSYFVHYKATKGFSYEKMVN